MQNNTGLEGFAVQAIAYPHHGVLDTHRLPPGGTGLALGLALQDTTNSYASPVAAGGPPLVYCASGMHTLSHNLLQLLACSVL